jgi:hypothetical protein
MASYFETGGMPHIPNDIPERIKKLADSRKKRRERFRAPSSTLEILRSRALSDETNTEEQLRCAVETYEDIRKKIDEGKTIYVADPNTRIAERLTNPLPQKRS